MEEWTSEHFRHLIAEHVELIEPGVGVGQRMPVDPSATGKLIKVLTRIRRQIHGLDQLGGRHDALVSHADLAADGLGFLQILQLPVDGRQLFVGTTH